MNVRHALSPRSKPVLGAIALCALHLLAASGSPAYAYTPRAFNGCLPITWAVQPKGRRCDWIRPLPDDVEGLRNLYPLPGVRREVAVLNTWYEPIVSSDPYPAANQFRLCKPSLGTAWNADLFADVCGLTNNQAGSTIVAAGQTLRTRFAFANYSTEGVDVVASLYFSSDAMWDAADAVSVTTRSFTVNANASSLQGRVWTVPSLSAGTYYVILRVEATTTAGVLRTDSIPLRGSVTVN